MCTQKFFNKVTHLQETEKKLDMIQDKLRKEGEEDSADEAEDDEDEEEQGPGDSDGNLSLSDLTVSGNGSFSPHV